MATIFAFYIWVAHWRHMKNTTEPSMCGSDAALCQITLITCLLNCYLSFGFSYSDFWTFLTFSSVPTYHLLMHNQLPYYKHYTVIIIIIMNNWFLHHSIAATYSDLFEISIDIKVQHFNIAQKREQYFHDLTLTISHCTPHVHHSIVVNIAWPYCSLAPSLPSYNPILATSTDDANATVSSNRWTKQRWPLPAESDLRPRIHPDFY